MTQRRRLCGKRRNLYDNAHFGFREVKQHIFYRKPLDEGVLRAD